MTGGAANLKIRDLTVVFGEVVAVGGGDADDRAGEPRGRRVAPPRLPVERGARAGVFPLPRAGFDVAVARGGALRRRAPDADPGAGAGGGADAAADGRAVPRALPRGPGPAALRGRNHP